MSVTWHLTATCTTQAEYDQILSDAQADAAASNVVGDSNNLTVDLDVTG